MKVNYAMNNCISMNWLKHSFNFSKIDTDCLWWT